MRLAKIYSNKPEIFSDIEFNDGLNVILGEIRLPGNRDKHTHNLGKTTLAEVIDFCLLRGRDSGFFLFKHLDRFEEFVFYLEVQVAPGSFVTVRRPVDGHSKVAFMKRSERGGDFRGTVEAEWDHWGVAIAAAKTLLDALLDLRALAPYAYRNAIAYSLRGQGDYDEPFKLSKYSGKHSTWKPFLAHILGLDSTSINRNFELADEIKAKSEEVTRLGGELSGVAEDRDQLRGLIEIKQREADSAEKRLGAYDFELSDADINRELVEELDLGIADLNDLRYHLSSSVDRVRSSLSSGVAFSLDRIEKLFEQAGVYFGDQLKKDYDDLVAFNREISEERNEYLEAELRDLEVELGEAQAELHTLNAKRSAALVHLRDKDTFSKYRRLSESAVLVRADLEVLARQQEAVTRMQELSKKVKELQARREEVLEAIEADIESPSDTYVEVRKQFDSLVHSVIERNANLFTTVNANGNVDYNYSIVDPRGVETGESRGHTYKRLLCVAFDMAIQLAHADEAYPHFLYHDGLFESLDDRPKVKLLAQVRGVVSRGIQYFLTVIDSELPLGETEQSLFEEGDVVLRLHDDGDQGRLFKMLPW